VLNNFYYHIIKWEIIFKNRVVKHDGSNPWSESI